VSRRRTIEISLIALFVAAQASGGNSLRLGAAQNGAPLPRRLPSAPVAAGPTDKPDVVAKRVFEGSAFWWKRRATVEVPVNDFGVFGYVGRAVKAVLHFLGRILSSILHFLSSLLPSLVPGLETASEATNFLLWVLAAVGVIVGSWMVYRFLRNRRTWDQMRVEPLQVPERLPDALVLLARAKAALEAGDTFEALRLGFLAILAGLEDRGIVRYDAARTNSEYLRDLRRQPALAADFRNIALPVDRAFYGKIRPERSDVERAFAFCQGLMTGPMATPAARPMGASP
jgi:hypothetical protein